MVDVVMKTMRELDEYANEIIKNNKKGRSTESQKQVAYADGIKYATRGISAEMLQKLSESPIFVEEPIEYPKVIGYMIPGYTPEYWGTWTLEKDEDDSFPNLVYRRSDGFTHAEPKKEIWNRIESGIILVLEA